MNDPSETALIVNRYLKDPESAVALVTLVEKTGSSYRQPGARMLVLRDGSTVGTISGGCLEGDLRNLSLEMEKDGRLHELKVIDTRPIFGCQGTITLFVERFAPDRARYNALMETLRQHFDDRKEISLRTLYGNAESPGTMISDGICGTTNLGEHEFIQLFGLRKRLLLIGAHGDVGCVIGMAKTLNWQCIQVVPGAQRTGWIAEDTGVEVLHADAQQLTTLIEADDATAVVIMTHNLGRDLSYAAAVLKKPFAYVGMLGSLKRRQELSDHIMDLGDEPLILALENLHCPIGLNIGSETQEEIALSILAEIQAVFSQRDGGKLKNSSLPIHANKHTNN